MSKEDLDYLLVHQSKEYETNRSGYDEENNPLEIYLKELLLTEKNPGISKGNNFAIRKLIEKDLF